MSAKSLFKDNNMGKKLYTALNDIRNVIVVAVVVFTVTLCLVQIVLRYFTFLSARPFSWGDEVVRLTSLWAIFLGMSIGVRENSHFAVDFFVNKIRDPREKHAYKVVLDAVVILLFSVVAYQGMRYAMQNVHSTLQNVDTLSMAWFYAAIPVGACYCIMEYVYRLVYGPEYKTRMLGGKK